MMPFGSMITPEPSDLAGRGSRPKKNWSNTERARRTVCSAAMLTTAGATFSTTSTTSLRREGRGEARTGPAREARVRRTAEMRLCRLLIGQENGAGDRAIPRRGMAPDTPSPRPSPGGRGRRKSPAGAGLIVIVLDPAGLGLLALGQLDVEQAVGEGCLDLLAVHVVGQREGADKLAVRTLHPMERAPLLLGLALALAAQGQHAAFHLDLDLILLEAGKLRGHEDPVLLLDDVHRRNPRADVQLLVAFPARQRASEDSTEAIGQGTQFTIGVPGYEIHVLLLDWLDDHRFLQRLLSDLDGAAARRRRDFHGVSRRDLVLQYLLRQTIHHLLLNEPLQGPGAERRVVPARRQSVFRLRRPGQEDPAVGDCAGELAELDLHDLRDLFPRQAVEDDHVVDAVEELRPEMSAQRLFDLRLDFRLVHGARLGDPLRAQVRRHDDDRVLE